MEIGQFGLKVGGVDAPPLLLSIEGEKIECSYFTEEVIEEVEVEVVNYATDFNKRNHGLLDESCLQELTVAIIGLGSGGGAIAVDLVRCGVTNLILVEFDTVSINNPCRSVYDLADIGRKKTEALYEKLLRINPYVNVQLHDDNILEMDDEKRMNIIEQSDLIIEATDNPRTKVLINGLAYHTTPVIYPGVYDKGRGGDILFTMPGLPCFECVFKSIIPEMMEVRGSGWKYSSDEAVSMPALISDIQVVIAQTVKLALAILTGDRDDSFIEKITERGCSMLFIGNEKDFFIFDKPFQEIWAETEVNPKCSCQTLQ